MNTIKLYAFTAGTYIVDKGLLNNTDWGLSYKHPVPMYLVVHPKGNLVFDTGLNHRGLSDRAAWWGKSMEGIDVIIKEEDCLPFRLRKMGIDPQTIKYVALSHMHIDHAGEMASFPAATFIVRSAELSFAWWPDRHQKYTYAFRDYEGTRDYDFLEVPDAVDFDVFQDGTVLLIHTPGHTPGHQSLVIKDPGSGKRIVLCQDACYMRENLNGQVFSTRLMWSVHDWLQSIQRLRYLEGLGYELWMGHEMEDWEEKSRRYKDGQF